MIGGGGPRHGIDHADEPRAFLCREEIGDTVDLDGIDRQPVGAGISIEPGADAFAHLGESGGIIDGSCLAAKTDHHALMQQGGGLAKWQGVTSRG